jgi:hypothetical protein
LCRRAAATISAHRGVPFARFASSSSCTSTPITASGMSDGFDAYGAIVIVCARITPNTGPSEATRLSRTSMQKPAQICPAACTSHPTHGQVRRFPGPPSR